MSNPKGDSDTLMSSIDRMYLSMNLSSVSAMKRIERLEKRTKDIEAILEMSPDRLKEEYAKGRVAGNTVLWSLVDIIKSGYKNIPNEFDVDLIRVGSLIDSITPKDTDNDTVRRTGGPTGIYKKYYDTFFKVDSDGSPSHPKNLSVYFTSIGSADNHAGYITTNYQPSPHIGAALMSVMWELRMEIAKEGKFAHLGVARGSLNNKSVSGNAHTDYIKHSKENMLTTTKSSLAQVPDDTMSMSRLWPVAKVYFVDYRGTDIVAEDIFFSSDSILDINITLDKDDADLCVIRISDPLRFIQNASFFSKNKISTSANDSFVAGNKRGATSSLKSGKIEQGRPIQVRMGYSSVAENLQTVFTGRITEVELGDVVTIVAQGWKAELINRQVNFYTERQQNWGPKDLAVLATQLADPVGIGEHIPEHEARKIIDLAQDNQQNIADLVQRIQEVQRGTQKVYGTDAFSSWVDSDFWTDFWSKDDDQRWYGLDTRLKNIWYPDVRDNIHDHLIWRTIIGSHPDHINDAWLVPLQPAWNVLQEAARHTWNHIVQVVPYDAEATLFFGQPDQMYYYTRGDKVKTDQWKKFQSAIQTSSAQIVFNEIIQGFLQSDEYSSPTGLSNIPARRGNFTDLNTIRSIVTDDTDFLSRFGVYVNTSVDAISGGSTWTNLNVSHRVLQDIRPVALHGFYRVFLNLPDLYRERVLKSGLPLVEYKYLSDVLGEHDVFPMIMLFMFGISPSKIKSVSWNYRRDLLALLESQNPDKSSRASGIYDQAKANPLRMSGISLHISKKLSGKETEINSILQGPIGTIRSALSGALTSQLEVAGNNKVVTVGEKQGRYLHRPGFPDNRPVVQVRYNLYDFSDSLEELERFSTDLGTGTSLTQRLKEAIANLRDTARLQNAAEVTTNSTSSVSNVEFVGTFRQHSIPTILTGANLRGKHNDNVHRALYIVESILTNINRSLSQKTIIEDIDTNGVAVPIYPIESDISVGELLDKHGPTIKSFIYFLGQYVRGIPVSAKVKEAVGSAEGTLAAPNMRTFRVHHHVSSSRDIISNKIAASTSQMWNTVVINRPAGDPDDVAVLDNADEDNFQRGAMLNSSVGWEYWPSTSVSKVIGLQFQPGITIANKKVRSFTEVNCHTDPLAARIACNHLAQGMRQMYIGTLAIRGRVIKPYDVIILDDSYTRMEGPIEVESVVHHFSPDMGWVTNIKPCAYCEANPGSSAVQVAVMEAAYRMTMRNTDTIFTAINIGILLATGGLGGGLSAFVLSGARNLIATAARATVQKGGAKAIYKNVATRVATSAQEASRNIANGTARPMALATDAIKNLGLGKLATRYFTSVATEAAITTGIHHWSNHVTTSAWVNGAKDVEQLPTILSPLMYNGAPWTAGLEADEALFSVPFYGLYASYHDIVTTWTDFLSNQVYLE